MESDISADCELTLIGKLTKILNESFSLNVEATEPKGHLALSIAAALEELMRLHIDVPDDSSSPSSNTASIREQMRTEFERADLWQHLEKRIPAARDTNPGDRLRIDA